MAVGSQAEDTLASLRLERDALELQLRSSSSDAASLRDVLLGWSPLLQLVLTPVCV
jgi:hypothetical protein